MPPSEPLLTRRALLALGAEPPRNWPAPVLARWIDGPPERPLNERLPRSPAKLSLTSPASTSEARDSSVAYQKVFMAGSFFEALLSG
jgi:hypothetical protein